MCALSSPTQEPLPQNLRNNVVRRRNRLRHQPQVVCLQWWGRLQPANARLRAHFFTASHGRGSDESRDRGTLWVGSVFGHANVTPFSTATFWMYFLPSSYSSAVFRCSSMSGASTGSLVSSRRYAAYS